jgi:anti-anti-sigma regulatory factor
MGITLAMPDTPIPFAPVKPNPDTRSHAWRSEPGPIRLSVSLTWWDRRSVVLLAGDLDADTSVALGTAFDQLVGSGFDEVVLDVSAVRQFDESGAVALAELWARLRNDGISCRVRGLPPMCADSPLELLVHIRRAGPFGRTRHMSPANRND